MLANGCPELPPDRFGMVAQQRQVTVGRSTGEQINHPVGLQCREAGDQITVASEPTVPVMLDRCLKMFGGILQSRIGVGQQVESLVQPARNTLFEIRITEQGQQGRRQSDGDPRSAGRIC